MDESLVGEAGVFEETDRVVRVVSEQGTGGYFRWIPEKTISISQLLGAIFFDPRVKAAVGQTSTLCSQVPRVLRRVIVELKH